MSNDESKVSGVTLPKFSGKLEDYVLWIQRWWAFATFKGFETALKEGTCNLPSRADATLDKNNPSEKVQIEGLARNDKALLYLTMAFDSTVLMSKINKTKSAEFLNGIAWKVMVQLKRENQPEDTTALAECRNDMMKLVLRKNEAPTTLSDKLNAIVVKHKVTVSTAEEVASVISAAPSIYAGTIASVQREKRNAGEDVEVEHLIEAMQEQSIELHRD